MKKTVQLIKSGHPTHDIVINLVRSELIKRGYNILMSHRDEPKSLKWNSSIYFTYFLIIPRKFSKIKKHHPSIYGMHGLSLIKNAVSIGYLQFDCCLMPTESWKMYWCKKLPQFKNLNIEVVNGAAKLDLFYNVKTNKKEICKKYNLDYKLPVILYIPSYGTRPGVVHYGSEYLVDEILDEVNRLKVNVLYLVHPVARDKEQAGLREKYRYKFLYVANKAELYSICDLFIGDISGAISESLIFNKPVIRVKKGSEFYTSKDFNLFESKKLVDIGDIVDVSELHCTIKRNLLNDVYEVRRKWWLDNWVGTIDGQCTKREVDCMEKFAKFWWTNPDKRRAIN